MNLNTNRYSSFIAVFLVLLFGLYFVFTVVKTTVDKKVEDSFLALALNTRHSIEENFTIYENIVRAGVGLYSSEDNISRGQWKNFLDSQSILERYPSIKALEYIDRVSSEEKGAFIQNVQNEGFSTFNIKPEGEREEYFVVNYIEPIEGNEGAFGFDLGSNPDRLEALETARDTNEFTLTTPIILVQNEETTVAFLGILPVYRNNSPSDTLGSRRENLKGFILSVLTADDLFREVARVAEEGGGVHFELIDIDTSQEFFTNIEHTDDHTAEVSEFIYSGTIEVGGKIWKINVHPTPLFFDKLSNDLLIPKIIFAAEVILSLIVLFFFFFLNRTKKKALKVAKDMTHNFKLEKGKVESSLKELEEKTQTLDEQFLVATQARQAAQNILEDVAEERDNTEIEKKKINSLINGLTDGVVFFDTNKKSVLVNSAMVNMTGLPLKGFYLAELSKLFSKEKIDFDVALDEVLKEKKVRFISNLPFSSFTYQAVIIPVLDDEGVPQGSAVVLHDITREQEIDREKTEFVSLASHQLKTPVGAINWNIEMLLDGDYGDIPDNQREILRGVYTMSQRINQLINGLLNISRIDMGVFIIEPLPTDFIELCREVLEEMKPRTLKKKHEIVEDFPEDFPITNADPKLLRIIFQNFISNAIKYTQDEGKIKVSLSSDEKGVMFSVSNNGEPIPEKEQSKIFQKLFRASNARVQDPDGNGLGLYIVKEVVENAGGRVWFTSKEGEDTVFSMSLPLSGMLRISGEKELS
ncbi:hypothetical protein COB52_02090 [Candidatus Kaiserbacteria bacterium]|nr:MAG: hypothetical protein COB52_02090 [Candidatus Kaiserbacteria bacterium]